MKKIIFIILLLIIGFIGAKFWQDSKNAEPATVKDIVGADLPPATTSTEAEKLVTIPFYNRAEKDFKIKETYYVAINEPGASNDNNGLYPTYQGGVNGPFKDLNSKDDRVRMLLQDKSEGVKLILRQGVYKLIPTQSTNDSGLVLRGSGDEFHPVIITSYYGETVILDGGEKLPTDQLKRVASGKESYDIKIRQVIQLEGQYNIVENLTIRDGFRHNIVALGQYSIIRNNILEGAYEDSVKNTVTSDYGILLNNDISGFGSQGLDHFGADNWLIKGNNIHDPGIDPAGSVVAGNGIGAKGGNNNVVIIDNIIHDFDTQLDKGAIVLGGIAAAELYERNSRGQILPSVTHGIAIGNTIYNYRGPAVHFPSCHNCAFSENKIYNTVGAFRLGTNPEVRESSEDVRVTPYTNGTVIKNNHFTGNDAKCTQENSVKLGMTCYVFYIETNEDARGLVSENNTYYTDTPPPFVYRYNGQIQKLDHKQFIELLETDKTSRVSSRNRFINN